MTDGIGFALTSEQKMLQQLARDFARNEIAPVAEHYDRTAEFPTPVIEKARQAGLINTNIPLEYDGGGASLIEEAIVGYQMSTLYFDGAHLARLAVTPRVQGQRVGSALVEDMLGHFHQRGVQTMTVNTQQSNAISQQLYERQGFRRNGYDLPVWICSLTETAPASERSDSAI